MSAIWGLIFRKKDIDIQNCYDMKRSMSDYKLDRIEEITESNAYFACGHQYITIEAVSDISPIYNKDMKFIFVGDCFLYNRDEVIDLLAESNISSDFDKDECSIIGDCELAYRLYLQKGENFVGFLRGAFSFAIYDYSTEVLHLFSDHFVKRYLAYHIAEDYICFSSVYKPILACLGDGKTLNREFIANMYRHISPMGFFVPELTVYEDVFHLEEAMHVTINVRNGEKESEHYWNPVKSVKRKKKISDEKCRELFLDTFRKASVALLRARRNTGIMLSGGYDSSSVAGMTAPALKEKGQKLYSYTTIPSTGYQERNSKAFIENEKVFIEAQKEFHGNLVVNYINGDSDNCLSDIETHVRQCDLPVKPIINNVNINNMCKAAARDECSILLSGSNGNPTISYGTLGNCTPLFFFEGKWIRLFNELCSYSKRYKLSRKKVLCGWVKHMYGYHNEKVVPYDNFLKQEYREKYHIDLLAFQDRKKFGDDFYETPGTRMNFMFMPEQYIQKSFYYTNLGLQYGFLQLDPTLSVEMVELSISLPSEAFFKNGVERRLVKEYMQGLIPEIITDDRTPRGVQAADASYRVNRDWDNIKDDIYSILGDKKLLEYVDARKLEVLLTNVKKNEYKLDNNTVWELANLVSLGAFLRIAE